MSTIRSFYFVRSIAAFTTFSIVYMLSFWTLCRIEGRFQATAGHRRTVKRNLSADGSDKEVSKPKGMCFPSVQ